MKTKETARPDHYVLKLMGRLRNDKFQLSMRERTLLADLLESHLKRDVVLQLGLKIARTAVDKRTGTRIALLAVIHYLKTCGVSPKLSDPLHDLWCALADVDRGISNELVDRKPYHSGTQKGIRKTLAWATAAARVTLLIKKDKMPATAALKRVAKEKGLDSKKLREFRKNIQRGHVSPRAQKYYSWFLEDLADPLGAEQRHLQRQRADTTESELASFVAVIDDLARGLPD